MKKFKALDKGEYQYINNRKHRLLLFSSLSLLVVLIIFLTGIIIYHTNKSIFAVIAAVSALPAAKLVTLYAVIIPYNTGDKTIYDRLCELKAKQKGVIVCDLAIASSTKTSFIQFAYIADEKVILYTDYKKIDINYAEKYIKDILNQNCNFSSVKLYTDKKKFLERAEGFLQLEEENSMDRRIADKLISFSM